MFSKEALIERNRVLEKKYPFLIFPSFEENGGGALGRGGVRARLIERKQFYEREEKEEKVERKDCFQYFLITTDDSSVDQAGYLDQNASSSGMLSRISQKECEKFYNNSMKPIVHVPYFEPQSNLSQIQNLIYQQVETLNNANLSLVKVPPLYYLLPDAYVHFHQIDYQNSFLNYSCI